MQLFHAHFATERQKLLNTNHNGNPTSSDLLHIASCFPFSVPVLPGDASLALDFMASFKIQIGDQAIDDCVLECVAQALFNLVILRTYLGRPPENDLDIFEAVCTGQICRIWTSDESALAACFGESNTSPHAEFDSIPSPELWAVRVARDINMELMANQQFVRIKLPISWTSRSGLTGGPRKPRHYRPSYLQLLEPGPRPKPRPAFWGNNDRPDATIAKQRQNTMSDVENPATKKTSAKKLAADQDALLDEVEQPVRCRQTCDKGQDSERPPKCSRHIYVFIYSLPMGLYLIQYLYPFVPIGFYIDICRQLKPK